ncbi:MAG: FAD-dependent oxidoreductase [Chloroflexi bacterium]|nr:FAD-dependent oxidoreductase [Chloroflexota bacterium]
MDQKELREIEAKCIQECAPACTSSCPTHVDVKTMLAEVAKGDFSAALRTYRKAVPFPGIIGRLCDQPCQDVCLRRESGGAIAIRDLERAAVTYGQQLEEKSRPLPKRRGHVAVVGGGISGLSAAYELVRKGYAVTIFETGSVLGGSLWRIDRDYLPARVITDDLEMIERLGIDVQLNTPIPGPIAELRREHEAVYLAIGALTEAHFDDLERDEYGFVKTDAVTLETSVPGVFAGGGMRWGKDMRSSITSISEGRRAAISIDRHLQRVSLTASRINEGSYKSCLYTNTAGIVSELVTQEGNGWYYDRDEAMREASRCIQCECMECVKACEYLKHYERYPRRYVREIYNNLSIVKGTRYANTFINSCSLCGLCGELCPEDLDMGEVNLAARQSMVEQGRMPASAFDFALREMAFSNSDHFSLVRNAPGTSASDYVLFPGCQLCASSPQHVEAVYAHFRDRLAQADVGLMLGCCGAPAKWAGDSALFERTTAHWREALKQMGDPTVILPCPSCYQTFKTTLPDVQIVSLWEALEQVGLPEGVQPVAQRVAIHDPCSARRERPMQDSARRLAERLGCTIEELPLSREKTVCCSYGGHMWLANPEIAKKTVKRRIDESTADYLTYCAMCRDFFANQGKRALHLLDLVYGTPDDCAARPNPGWSQRREHRVQLRRRFLITIWGEEMDDAAPYESIRLVASDEVRALLEQRLILTEDIQRVIEYAERTKRRLRSPKTGHFLAYYKPHTVTYWVEYLPQDDGYVVFNAYSHRMDVPGSDLPGSVAPKDTGTAPS